MDPKTVLEVGSIVFTITQEYSEALNLFIQWRKGSLGKKAVGQEECKTSLEEGISTIEGKFQQCSQQYGTKFDRGDRLCLDSLVEIRAKFKQDVLERLSRNAAGKLAKIEKIDPIALIKRIESTRKETILALDELSRRIRDGTAEPYTTTHPGDRLPYMPLWLKQDPKNLAKDPNSSDLLVASRLQGIRVDGPEPCPLFTGVSASHAQTLPGSAQSSQNSFSKPLAPIPQRLLTPMTSSWTLPDFGTSQALVRARPSGSTTALSWMKDIFPAKSTRPYYDIAPLEPIPAVRPTFTCSVDTMDILEEGQRAAQRLWDAAECEENDKFRQQAKLAPISQEPWKGIFDDDENDEDQGFQAQPPKTDMTPKFPDEEKSQIFLRPILPGIRPSSVHGDRRVRSQPKLEFSVVTPRFRRQVSNPETHPNW